MKRPKLLNLNKTLKPLEKAKNAAMNVLQESLEKEKVKLTNCQNALKEANTSITDLQKSIRQKQFTSSSFDRRK